MSIKNSPREHVRSFNLSIPSVIAVKQAESTQLTLRSPEFQHRKLSENSNLPSIAASRKKLESFEIPRNLLYDEFKSTNNFLKKIGYKQAIKYLPYVYAQNGFEKSKDLFRSSLGTNTEKFLPLQRKKSSIDIFEVKKENRGKIKMGKDEASLKNRSFDSI